MKARVIVTLKSGVLDPQGHAIEGSFRTLNIEGVNAVRQGKVFDLVLDATDEMDARSQVAMMCEKLLANTVIENYAIEISL